MSRVHSRLKTAGAGLAGFVSWVGPMHAHRGLSCRDSSISARAALAITALCLFVFCAGPARTQTPSEPIREDPAPHAPAPATAPSPSVEAPVAAGPVAQRPPEFVTLQVPGYEPSVVSFPPSAALPQPVLISTHGAGDSTQEMCEVWRGILGDRGVVLCPAGPRIRAHEEGRYYPDHHALERITFANVQALAEQYGAFADTKRLVYTGYSQGATMGALMIPEHGDECPRLVLVEGGFDDWSVVRAGEFRKAGGERVLFACGRRACQVGAEKSAAWLRGAGVQVRIVSHIGEGHVIHVAELARAELPWLLDGDPRWAAPDTAR